MRVRRRSERDRRIAIRELPQALGAEHQAGDRHPAVHRLVPVRHRAVIDELADPVADHTRVDAEVTVVTERGDDVVDEGAQPDLQRGVVFDERGDVARRSVRRSP